MPHLEPPLPQLPMDCVDLISALTHRPTANRLFDLCEDIDTDLEEIGTNGNMARAICLSEHNHPEIWEFPTHAVQHHFWSLLGLDYNSPLCLSPTSIDQLSVASASYRRHVADSFMQVLRLWHDYWNNEVVVSVRSGEWKTKMLRRTTRIMFFNLVDSWHYEVDFDIVSNPDVVNTVVLHRHYDNMLLTFNNHRFGSVEDTETFSMTLISGHPSYTDCRTRATPLMFDSCYDDKVHTLNEWVSFFPRIGTVGEFPIVIE